jgi:hypothetical protein
LSAWFLVGALLRLETEDDCFVGVRTEKKALAGAVNKFSSVALAGSSRRFMFRLKS